jgi:hypothetical protein
MTRIARIAKSFAASVVAALALCAAATAAGPTISAGYGCAVACIESALVTPTASSASVEVKTSVPASVTVTAARLDAELGLAAGPAPKHVSVPPFLTNRTVILSGLEPETTYRIVVSAKDLQGRVQTRSGTFTTRKVKVAVDLPDVGLSAGLGCKADCIGKGTLTSDPVVPGRARLELVSSVPATFQVSLIVKTISGDVLDERVLATGSRKTTYTATLDRLLTGTTYSVTAKATDERGHAWVEQGTFRTRSATALVIFHKVKIIDDGDKGANRGEIALDFRADGEAVHSIAFKRYGSGDTVVPKMPGTSRPGVWKSVSIDRQERLDLLVGGVECDWQRLSKCPREGGGNDYSARATTTVDLGEAFLPDDGLPPGYGTGLPAGHDAYAVFETTDHSLKFRVYATVDVRVS